MYTRYSIYVEVYTQNIVWHALIEFVIKDIFFDTINCLIQFKSVCTNKYINMKKLTSK